MTAKDRVKGVRGMLEWLYGRTNCWQSDMGTIREIRGKFKPESWKSFPRSHKKAIFREILKIKAKDRAFHKAFRI